MGGGGGGNYPDIAGQAIFPPQNFMVHFESKCIEIEYFQTAIPKRGVLEVQE